jgi:seryl-tRNA synthetase
MLYNSAMLDIKVIRENAELVQQAILDRGMSAEVADVDGALELDAQRRAILVKVEEMKHERNQASEKIVAMKKQGGDTTEITTRMREISDRIKEMDAEVRSIDEALRTVMLDIPNIPDASVPVGPDETSNVEVRRFGKPPAFTFKPKPHWDVGEPLDILDFERGAKIAAARFTLLKGAGARLERALINFMLDLHTGEHGYTEVFPPILANEETFTTTGQLPKFREDMYQCQDGLLLVPTAEVPVTNIHRDEILREEDLTINYVGRLVRQGRARHHPPAPVQQGRDGQVRAPGQFVRRAREDDLPRGGGPPPARDTPQGSAALNGRPRVLGREVLRPRGVDAGFG